MKPNETLNPGTSTLYVRRDWSTEGQGRWRLYWSEPGSSSCLADESTVTGNPYFRTMKDAREYGESKYNQKVFKADW